MRWIWVAEKGSSTFYSLHDHRIWSPDREEISLKYCPKLEFITLPYPIALADTFNEIPRYQLLASSQIRCLERLTLQSSWTQPPETHFNARRLEWLTWTSSLCCMTNMVWLIFPDLIGPASHYKSSFIEVQTLVDADLLNLVTFITVSFCIASKFLQNGCWLISLSAGAVPTNWHVLSLEVSHSQSDSQSGYNNSAVGCKSCLPSGVRRLKTRLNQSTGGGVLFPLSLQPWTVYVHRAINCWIEKMRGIHCGHLLSDEVIFGSFRLPDLA